MRRAINRQTQTNTPGWERGVIWVMSMFMMLDSSITAVQAEWHADFIIIIINSVIMTSCNHIIIHALTQPCMRSNEACCPLRENIIERTLEQWGRAARFEAWVFNTAHFNVDRSRGRRVTQTREFRSGYYFSNKVWRRRRTRVNING